MKMVRRNICKIIWVIASGYNLNFIGLYPNFHDESSNSSGDPLCKSENKGNVIGTEYL